MSPYGLGLADGVFWEMTFRELHALGDVRNQRLEYDLFGTACIRSDLYNKWYERRDGRKYTPEDFMGRVTSSDDRTPEQRIEDQKSHILSVLQMAAAVNGVN